LLFCGGDRSVKIFGQRWLAEIFVRSFRIAARHRDCDDGKIFVGVKDHIEIHTLRQAHRERRTFGEKSYVTSIALAADALFVADAGNREIIRCDFPAKLFRDSEKKNADNPGFAIPSAYFDLSLGSDGLLWTTNTGRHQVEAYMTDGKFELGWGATGMAIENFCGCCNPVHITRLPTAVL